MVKKLVVLVLLLVFCSISAFAQFELWATISQMFNERTITDPELNSCNSSPDVIIYNGSTIRITSACRQHDRDYDNKVDRGVADRRLGDNIYSILRSHGVPDSTARKIAGIYVSGVSIYGGAYYPR